MNSAHSSFERHLKLEELNKCLILVNNCLSQ